MPLKPTNNLNEFSHEVDPGQGKEGFLADINRQTWAKPGDKDYQTRLASNCDNLLPAFEHPLERSTLIANDHLHELMAQSFYMETPLEGRTIKASDLVDAGVIDGSAASDAGDRRSPSHVRQIIIKETSKEALTDPQAANYLISDKHIPIAQLQHPDHLPKHKGDHRARATDEITIYLDDGAPGHHHDLSERQKASLRLLLSWENTRYKKAHREIDLPADVLKALVDEVRIPNETESEKTDGYNPHPFPWWLKKWWSKDDEVSDDTCGTMAPVPAKGTSDYDNFVDKLVKVLSVNEGKKTSLTRNDNGSGISVGEAQWNQKKGELPNLLQAWLDKDPEFFKSTFAPYLDQMLNADHKIDEGKDSKIRSMEMGSNDDFCKRMQVALDYKSYQDVQDVMVRNKAERAITIADKYGHHSQRFVAEVLDVANEKGWGGCEARLRKANVAAIPEEEECTALKKFEQAASDRVNAKQRDKNLDKMFAPERTALDLGLWQKSAS